MLKGRKIKELVVKRRGMNGIEWKVPLSLGRLLKGKNQPK